MENLIQKNLIVGGVVCVELVVTLCVCVCVYNHLAICLLMACQYLHSLWGCTVYSNRCMSGLMALCTIVFSLFVSLKLKRKLFLPPHLLKP